MAKSKQAKSPLRKAGKDWKRAKGSVLRALGTTLSGLSKEADVLTKWVKSGEGAAAIKAAGASISRSFWEQRARVLGKK